MKSTNRPKPVTKIELTNKHPRIRMFIVVTLVIIGVAALTYGAVTYFRGENGWHTIALSSSSESTISEEITLEYYLGAKGNTAYAERRELTKLYSDALWAAEKLFDTQKGYIDVNNVYYLNRHANEATEVPAELYKVLEMLAKYNDRHIFLGPLYGDYNALMFSKTDEEAMEYDPAHNADQADFVKQIAAFASDENRVSIELLADNKVRLNVSAEYMAYAKDMGVENFIDFYWMKNAFIVDMIADTLKEAGYTHGFISSYDGYLRNIDDRNQQYAYQLIDRQENVVSHAGELMYSKPMAAVMFKNYRLNSMDGMHYYEYADGTIKHVYLDVSDGLCKSSINDLVLYSYSKSCAELMLAGAGAFIADSFDIGKITSSDLFYVYYDNYDIIVNDKACEIRNIGEKYSLR